MKFGAFKNLNLKDQSKRKPSYPKPRSPVQSARKFSAVFGTTSDLNSITMRPIYLILRSDLNYKKRLT